MIGVSSYLPGLLLVITIPIWIMYIKKKTKHSKKDEEPNPLCSTLEHERKESINVDTIEENLKAEETRKKYDEDIRILSEKLKGKDEENRKFQEITVSIQNHAEDLQKCITNKEREYKNKLNIECQHNAQLKNIIQRMGDNIENKSHEMEKLKKLDEVQKQKVSELSHAFEELKKSFCDKEKQCSEEIDKNEQMRNFLKNLYDEINVKNVRINHSKEEVADHCIDEDGGCDMKFKGVEECNEYLRYVVVDAVRTIEDKALEITNLNVKMRVIVCFLKRILGELRIFLDTNEGVCSRGSEIIVERVVDGLENVIRSNSNGDERMAMNINDNPTTFVLMNSVQLEREEKLCETIIPPHHFTRDIVPAKEFSANQNAEHNNQISELIIQNKILEDGCVQITLAETFDLLQNTSAADHCSDKEEINKLRFHAKKLEMELLQMQGRYYILKQDLMLRKPSPII